MYNLIQSATDLSKVFNNEFTKDLNDDNIYNNLYEDEESLFSNILLGKGNFNNIDELADNIIDELKDNINNELVNNNDLLLKNDNNILTGGGDDKYKNNRNISLNDSYKSSDYSDYVFGACKNYQYCCKKSPPTMFNLTKEELNKVIKRGVEKNLYNDFINIEDAKIINKNVSNDIRNYKYSSLDLYNKFYPLFKLNEVNLLIEKNQNLSKLFINNEISLPRKSFIKKNLDINSLIKEDNSIKMNIEDKIILNELINFVKNSIESGLNNKFVINLNGSLNKISFDFNKSYDDTLNDLLNYIISDEKIKEIMMIILSSYNKKSEITDKDFINNYLKNIFNNDKDLSSVLSFRKLLETYKIIYNNIFESDSKINNDEIKKCLFFSLLNLYDINFIYSNGSSLNNNYDFLNVEHLINIIKNDYIKRNIYDEYNKIINSEKFKSFFNNNYNKIQNELKTIKGGRYIEIFEEIKRSSILSLLLDNNNVSDRIYEDDYLKLNYYEKLFFFLQLIKATNNIKITDYLVIVYNYFILYNRKQNNDLNNFKNYILRSFYKYENIEEYEKLMKNFIDKNLLSSTNSVFSNVESNDNVLSWFAKGLGDDNIDENLKGEGSMDNFKNILSSLNNIIDSCEELSDSKLNNIIKEISSMGVKNSEKLFEIIDNITLLKYITNPSFKLLFTSLLNEFSPLINLNSLNENNRCLSNSFIPKKEEKSLQSQLNLFNNNNLWNLLKMFKSTKIKGVDSINNKIVNKLEDITYQVKNDFSQGNNIDLKSISNPSFNILTNVLFKPLNIQESKLSSNIINLVKNLYYNKFLTIKNLYKNDINSLNINQELIKYKNENNNTLKCIKYKIPFSILMNKLFDKSKLLNSGLLFSKTGSASIEQSMKIKSSKEEYPSFYFFNSDNKPYNIYFNNDEIMSETIINNNKSNVSFDLIKNKYIVNKTDYPLLSSNEIINFETALSNAILKYIYLLHIRKPEIVPHANEINLELLLNNIKSIQDLKILSMFLSTVYSSSNKFFNEFISLFENIIKENKFEDKLIFNNIKMLNNLIKDNNNLFINPGSDSLKLYPSDLLIDRIKNSNIYVANIGEELNEILSNPSSLSLKLDKNLLNDSTPIINLFNCISLCPESYITPIKIRRDYNFIQGFDDVLSFLNINPNDLISTYLINHLIEDVNSDSTSLISKMVAYLIITCYSSEMKVGQNGRFKKSDYKNKIKFNNFNFNDGIIFDGKINEPLFIFNDINTRLEIDPNFKYDKYSFSSYINYLAKLSSMINEFSSDELDSNLLSNTKPNEKLQNKIEDFRKFLIKTYDIKNIINNIESGVNNLNMFELKGYGKKTEKQIKKIIMPFEIETNYDNTPQQLDIEKTIKKYINMKKSKKLNKKYGLPEMTLYLKNNAFENNLFSEEAIFNFLDKKLNNEELFSTEFENNLNKLNIELDNISRKKTIKYEFPNYDSE